MRRRHHDDYDDDDHEHSDFVHTLLWPVRVVWSLIKGVLICTIWLFMAVAAISIFAHCAGSRASTVPVEQTPAESVCK